MTTLFPEQDRPKKTKPPAVLLPPRRDPFRVEGPAYVSFSGGRTSGYLLRRVLDSGLLPEVHVLFANTGKEREETLRFVRDVGERWGVPVSWLEYHPEGMREVTFATASRNGEPFAALIEKEGALPNRNMRFCTRELKIHLFHAFMAARYDAWTSVVGIRADEPRRAAKIRGRKEDPREEVRLPLFDAGVGHPEVLAFWAAQPFDLELGAHDSNCDLCFLKGAGERLRVMQREPERAAWWLAQEEQEGATWINPNSRRPSYTQLYQLAVCQGDLLLPEEEDSFDCFCGEGE